MSTPRRTDPGLLMTAQEQRIVYALAAAATLAFFVLWTPWHGGGHLTGFLIGTAMSAGFAYWGRRGHRLWAAFGSFLMGFNPAWSFAYIFGAAYIAFAFYLVWRANRDVKAPLRANADAVMGRATPLASSKTLRSRPQRKAPEPPKKTTTSGRVTPKKVKKAPSGRTSRTR